MDSTHFQTYGHQYGKSFNAHYQAQGFHPLMVFDGMTGDCLKVELRAGNVYTSRNIVSFIGPLLSHYQKKFPSSYRIVRGDSGFAHKELYKLCETLNTNYVIRLKANATLYRLAKEVMDVFWEECSLQYSQQFYGEFEYLYIARKNFTLTRLLLTNKFSCLSESIASSIHVDNIGLMGNTINHSCCNNRIVEDFIPTIKR